MIDMNKFTPGTQPAKDDGLLTILEEIPGQIHWEDMTATVSKEGFWSVAYVAPQENTLSSILRVWCG